MIPLSILCVTEYGEHSPPFIADMEEIAEQLEAAFILYDGRGAGCIENVLDQAVATCPDGMILRIDDDERCSQRMRDWLEDGAWQEADHWAFPRLNLWPNDHSYISNMGLYPDLQTRLSIKAKSGGRPHVHAGSPYGTGHIAAGHIEHHKFLVRSLDERRAILAGYEQTIPTYARHHFVPFSCPEDCPVDIAVVEMGRVYA